MNRIHGQTPRAAAQQTATPLNEGRFGRMFPTLPPAPTYSIEQLRQLADQMRAPDAGGGGWAGAGSPAAPDDNPEIPAGYTYFGQLVDHDITFDATSRIETERDPDALVSFRTPRYDLDSLYGSGPIDEPFQYDETAPGRLLLGANANGEPDLPRNAQQIALIGDPRNDENLIVSQLQLAMLRFHNRLVGDLEGTDPGMHPWARFDEARVRARWHYQWVVLNDYLRRICGSEVVDELIELRDGHQPKYRLRHYRPTKHAYIPIEFSAAAFRFGHSQVRAEYDINGTVGVRPLFVPGDGTTDFVDLRGHRALPPNATLDWSRFLPLNGSTPQHSQTINATLVGALFDLPRSAPDEEQSLALANLLTGQALGLPSGQDVASAMHVPPKSGAELGTQLDPTPLWFYLLKEAELETGGTRLGATGARLVAEVLIGLLRTDEQSFLKLNAAWRPTIPGTAGADGSFGLPDLVQYATGA